MSDLSRRAFLKRSGAALAGLVAAPTIVPNTVLGKKYNHKSPSDKMNILGVGIGGHGPLVKGLHQAYLGLHSLPGIPVHPLDLPLEAADLVGGRRKGGPQAAGHGRPDQDLHAHVLSGHLLTSIRFGLILDLPESLQPGPQFGERKTQIVRDGSVRLPS